MARKKKQEKVETENIAIEANTIQKPQLQKEEVEEHVRTVMKYNNITKTNQKSKLLELVVEQIGDQTTEEMITQCFKEILKP